MKILNIYNCYSVHCTGERIDHSSLDRHLYLILIAIDAFADVGFAYDMTYRVHSHDDIVYNIEFLQKTQLQGRLVVKHLSVEVHTRA